MVRESNLLGAETAYTEDQEANGAEVRYSFTDGLVEALINSDYWARLKLGVTLALTSKYSFWLYQSAALRANLFKKYEDFSIEAFREMLGVENGKYAQYKDFNKRVIGPACDELNFLSDMIVQVEPIRRGMGPVPRHVISRAAVTGYRLSWRKKTNEEWAESLKELSQSKIGRQKRWEAKNNKFEINYQQKPVGDDLFNYKAPKPIEGQEFLFLKEESIRKALRVAKENTGVGLDRESALSAWRGWVKNMAPTDRPVNNEAHFVWFCKERARKLM